jgi:hypothetical protein
MNPAPFSQIAVWHGVIIGPTQVDAFVQFCADEFAGTRVQYIREVETKPDVNEFGSPIEGTGGRNDVLFAVHEDDIGKFAVPRFHYGMRWLDDVYGNGDGYLYPADVRELLCWTNESSSAEVDEYREDGSETGCVGE